MKFVISGLLPYNILTWNFASMHHSLKRHRLTVYDDAAVEKNMFTLNDLRLEAYSLGCAETLKWDGKPSLQISRFRKKTTQVGQYFFVFLTRKGLVAKIPFKTSERLHRNDVIATYEAHRPAIGVREHCWWCRVLFAKYFTVICVMPSFRHNFLGEDREEMNECAPDLTMQMLGD